MVKAIRIAAPMLLVSWMVLIFVFSAQNATESSDTSGNFIHGFLNIVYPEFKTLTQAEKLQIVNSLQFYVRKGAHFTVYGVLGIFSFLSFVTYDKIKAWIRILLSLSVCLLYSVSDEIHQNFVAGRSCEFRDVIIDFCGSLVFIAVAFLIVRFTKLKGVLNSAEKRPL